MALSEKKLKLLKIQEIGSWNNENLLQPTNYIKPI